MVEMLRMAMVLLADGPWREAETDPPVVEVRDWFMSSIRVFFLGNFCEPTERGVSGCERGGRRGQVGTSIGFEREDCSSDDDEIGLDKLSTVAIYRQRNMSITMNLFPRQ
jgi:hypothetical protein